MSSFLADAPVQPHLGWRELLECASVEVVELMAGTRIQPWAAPYDEPRSDMVAIVRMAGALSGMTIVRCSSNTAKSLGLRMLGGKGAIADTTARDALGEICNLIAGNFKSKIDHLADGCKLSVPIVMSGGDFCPAAHNSIRVAFGLEGQPIRIALMIRG